MTHRNRPGAVEAARGLPLIFDLDGVVVDVRQSYRQAYILGITWFLNEILGRPGDAAGFTVADVALLKRHRGFNAPRDVVAFFLRAALVSDSADQRGGGFSRVSTWIKAGLADGRLDRGAEALFDGLSAQTRAAVRSVEDVDAALSSCHEVYIGSRNFMTVYGAAPRGDWPGLWPADRLLLPRDRPPCRLPLGVYSGRTRGEIDHLFERLPFFAPIAPAHVHSADDPGAKPDAEPLIRLIDSLGAGGAVYLGDTEADRQTVIALRRQRPDLVCLLAQIDEDKEAQWWPEAEFAATGPAEIVDLLGG